MVAIYEYVSYTTNDSLKAEHNICTTGNYTFKQYTTCCHTCSNWSHTTCKVCISIAANDDSSIRNSSNSDNQKFMEGYHVPRRSDMCWAGLSTHLIIEQVSVRRNARELALGVGVLAMLVCVCTNKTIQNFCDVSYEIGDQHNGTISMRDIR